MDLTQPIDDAPLGAVAPPTHDLTPARRAAAVVLGALALGVTTQALFWRTGIGLNFLLWTVLCTGACLASIRPRRLTAVGGGLVAAIVLLALAVVRYAGDWSFEIAVPATLALLAVLPVALRDEVGLARAGRLPLEALSALAPARAARALRDASRLPAKALGGRRDATKQIVKGLLAGLPLTVLFAALLASDVDFAQLLARVGQNLGDAASFGAWSLATTAGALVAHTLYRRFEPPPGVGASAPGAYRQGAPILAAPAELRDVDARGHVAESTWVVVLGQVAAVFGAFVAVNARSLFGGDALVRAPGSLTYAKYLHAGFGQLLVASVLSIWLVLAGHRLLQPRGAGSLVGRTPGGRVLVAVECALLTLTAVTVASCAQRLMIYEDAYGATPLRLGVAFILVAVMGALALTVAKVVRRGWTGYGGTLFLLFVALTVLASWTNADAYVARENLDRAARGKRLDVAYLASRSADASGVLTHPFVLADPAVARQLREAYCAGRPSEWRERRGAGCR